MNIEGDNSFVNSSL